jgi:hypothetical protein
VPSHKNRHISAVLIMNKTQVIRIGGTRSANAEGQGVLAF